MILPHMLVTRQQCILSFLCIYFYVTAQRLSLGNSLQTTEEWCFLCSLLINNWTSTEEQCFLYSPCQGRTISESCQHSAVTWLVSELLRWLLQFSSHEVLLLAGGQATGTVQKPRGRGTSTIRRCCQKTGEDTAGWEELSVCCSELQHVNLQ
jgi:hypothetical protein